MSLFESMDETVSFEPTRAAGLARLNQFQDRTGRHYAGQRNYDFGPSRRSNVSVLSPWIRHRMVTEEEVLTACLARHSPSGAEKFVQEVFWRGYFKGWLEHRPSVWEDYLTDLEDALETHGTSDAYKCAIEGRTGIECFDAWAQELVETGYLHNHARMWFASIWIFTLALPWQLGADFFLRHLLDGDPASNTLSWRWVGGLHTKGKTYLARASNIAKYTDGRFNPAGQLSPHAVPLEEDRLHPIVPLSPGTHKPGGEYLLLVTEDDCRFPELHRQPPAAMLGLSAVDARSPLPAGDKPRAFTRDALRNALPEGARVVDAPDWAEAIIETAGARGLTNVVAPYAPVGPTADCFRAARPALEEAGLTVTHLRRPYDDLVWPHATKGFFGLKKKIPNLLSALKLKA